MNSSPKRLLFRVFSWWREVLSRMIEESRSIDQLLLVRLRQGKRPTLRQLTKFLHILNTRERIALSLLSFLAIVSGALLIREITLLLFSPTPAPGGTYIEGVVGTPRFINPLYAVTNEPDMILVRLLFSGLIYFNERGEVEPYLAERVEVSPDAATYTVTLKPDLAWSDGEPLTSEDLRFTIEAIKNPLYHSPLRRHFTNVSVEVVDARTVRLSLPQPSAPFIENLTLGLLPAHLWSAIDPGSALLAELNVKPVSLGPYQFASFTKDTNGLIKQYTLTRRVSGVPRPPLIETVSFKFYQGQAEAISALEQKNIDSLLSAGVEKGKRSVRKDLAYIQIRLPQYTAIFFNPKSHTALANPAVRRALSLSLDRKKLIDDALGGEADIASGGPVPKRTLRSGNIATSTAYDIEAAKQLLAKAGWLMPAAGNVRIHSTSKQEMRFTLTTLNQEEYFRVAEMIQKFWQAIGVRSDLQLIDSIRLSTDIIEPRAYAALLIGELTGLDPDPYPFWHSSQTGAAGLNLSEYANREADRLLEQARKTNNRKLREEYYQKFLKILEDDAPAAFLYTPLQTYWYTKKVQGLTFPSLAHPADRFIMIDRWFMNTKWKLK